MKRRPKIKSNVYSYLKSKGVLEKGTHDDIQRIRNEYWKEYRRKWRNENRKAKKEFTISLSKDELLELTREARRHKLSKTQFIKQACFAYINKSFIVPDSLEVKRISQLLSMIYNSIRELLTENKVEFNSGRNLLESIQKLEREILPTLQNPKSIEEFISQHISKCPENKSKLLALINSI